MKQFLDVLQIPMALYFIEYPRLSEEGFTLANANLFVGIWWWHQDDPILERCVNDQIRFPGRWKAEQRLLLDRLNPSLMLQGKQKMQEEENHLPIVDQ